MLVGQGQKNVAMLMLHGVMIVHEYRQALPELGMCWQSSLAYLLTLSYTIKQQAQSKPNGQRHSFGARRYRVTSRYGRVLFV